MGKQASLREEIERWLLTGALAGVVWPLGLVSFVLAVSGEGSVSLRTVVGRGELLLIAGSLSARGLSQFGVRPGRASKLGLERQRATWASLSLLVFSMAGWAARIADVTGDPNLLAHNPPWTVTYLGGVLVLSALALGVAITAITVLEGS